MDRYLSEKLRILAFVAIIMVILQHAFCLGPDSPAPEAKPDFFETADRFIQTLFSEYLCKFAVPLFFTISGFLFFRKMKGTGGEFLEKFRKRFWSLLVPYLIWSFGNILFRIGLAASPLARFSTMELDASFNLSYFFYRLLFSPIEYHLWFLRDLSVMVVLSPLIYIFARYWGLVVLPLFFVFCLYNYHPVNLYFFTLGSNSVLFFTLGGFLAMRHDGISVLGKAMGRELPTVRFLAACRGWMLFIFCFTFWISISAYNAGTAVFDWPLLPRLPSYMAHLAGMVALWRGYDLLVRVGDFPLPAWILSFTFFIYLFHEPTLDILKKILFQTAGVSSWTRELAYWGGTFSVVALGVSLGFLLKSRTPAVYGLLTGAR